MRYGVLPPKEIVRPESSRIAMQGVQPKGVDKNNLAISPVRIGFYVHDIFLKIVFKKNKKRFLQIVRNADFIALASDGMIPVVGVEPTLLTEHDFESCASANSATPANRWQG